jgi:sugar phosphate isomerase/epimerase
MEDLMRKYADHPAVGYWHDFGHVQRKANLGYLDHVEWISKMQPYLIGCHLHDVAWPNVDHRVPLMAGGIDYDRIMPLISPEKPVVWELSPSRRKAQIIEALGLWRQKFGY